ncbi:MAG: zf-HC2 domain-containing protein [Armatimonadota bacterium]
MDNCRQLRRHIPGYLDGELTDSERSALELHLSQCAECRGEVESLLRSLDALNRCAQHYRENLYVPDMWTSIAARISTNERGWGFWRVRSVRAGAVAVLALAVGLFAVVRMSRVPEQTASRQVAKRTLVPHAKQFVPAAEAVSHPVQAKPAAKPPAEVLSGGRPLGQAGGKQYIKSRKLKRLPVRRPPRGGDARPTTGPVEVPSTPAEKPSLAGPVLLAALHDTASESVTAPASVARAGLEEMSAAVDLQVTDTLDKLHIAALMAAASHENGAGISGDL